MSCCKEDYGPDHNNDLNTGIVPALTGIWQAARTADILQISHHWLQSVQLLFK